MKPTALLKSLVTNIDGQYGLIRVLSDSGVSVYAMDRKNDRWEFRQRIMGINLQGELYTESIPFPEIEFSMETDVADKIHKLIMSYDGLTAMIIYSHQGYQCARYVRKVGDASLFRRHKLTQYNKTQCYTLFGLTL